MSIPVQLSPAADVKSSAKSTDDFDQKDDRVNNDCPSLSKDRRSFLKRPFDETWEEFPWKRDADGGSLQGLGTGLDIKREIDSCSESHGQEDEQLVVDEQENIGMVSRNQSGKTTLFFTLLGF